MPQGLPAEPRRTVVSQRNCRRLNISTNTVEQHIRKALRLLRESVETNNMLLLLINVLLLQA